MRLFLNTVLALGLLSSVAEAATVVTEYKTPVRKINTVRLKKSLLESGRVSLNLKSIDQYNNLLVVKYLAVEPMNKKQLDKNLVISEDVASRSGFDLQTLSFILADNKDHQVLIKLNNSTNEVDSIEMDYGF